MSEIFLVVWSGGFEAPQYQAFRTSVEAWAVAETWAQDFTEGDTIDVLSIQLSTLEIDKVGGK